MDNHEHDMDELMKKGWSYPKNKVSEDEGNILERRENGLYVPASGVSISKEEGNALTQKTDGLYVPAGAVEISKEDGNLIEQKTDGIYVGKTEPDISEEEDNAVELKEDGLYVPKTEIDISPDKGNILEKKENGLYVPEVKGVEISEEEGNTIELKEDGLYSPKCSVDISEETGNTIVKKTDGLFVPEVKISEEDGNVLESLEDGLYSPESKTKILEIDAALTEAELLEHISTNYEGYECSGFFYNADQNAYCEFEALYSPKQIGSETVHFGYCHIKGMHNTVYSADYFIDDEDGSTWIKRVPNDYIDTSDSVELKDSDVIATSMAVATLNDKVKEIELFKFPNAIIHGNPSIKSGQISDFSVNNYLAFPFLVDFGDRDFTINMAFTTGSDVVTQQNIIDGKFGLAFAIQNGKFVIAISSNGTSWDIGVFTGNHDVLPNTNYYIKIYFNRLQYKVSYSFDKISYVDDITKVATQRPYPVQIYIGTGNIDTSTPTPFSGIINMNDSYVVVNGTTIWQGMDDVGLATRLATDLANIDDLGIEAIKEIIATEDYAKDSEVVKKETGKSLVLDTDIAQITTNKEAIATLNGNAETEGSVKKTVADAIAATTHLTKQIIDHKPTVEEAKENILYLVPSGKEGVYKQYTLVGNEIIDLDNTEVDLSGYVQKEEGKGLSTNDYINADKTWVSLAKPRINVNDEDKTVTILSDEVIEMKCQKSSIEVRGDIVIETEENTNSEISMNSDKITINSYKGNSIEVGESVNIKSTDIIELNSSAEQIRLYGMSSEFNTSSIEMGDGIDIEGIESKVSITGDSGILLKSRDGDVEVKTGDDGHFFYNDKEVATVDKIAHNTCVNLLQPTLGTETKNGVTCTNNGDGTYTLNGTASGGNADFYLIDNIEYLGLNKLANNNIKIVGCPKNGTNETYRLIVSTKDWSGNDDFGNGFSITLTDNYVRLFIFITEGYTCNNLIFKPMLTTDLNATYDDFVPYTGDTGRLNGDVADLRSDVDNAYENLYIGKNLLNPDTCVNGLVSHTDGILTWYDNWISSDYIQVKPDTNYVASTNQSIVPNPVVRVCLYDTNKNFIYGTVDVKNFKTTSNTAYVRVTFGTSRPLTPIQFFNEYYEQIEEGTQATPYKPYIPNNAEITTNSQAILNLKMLGWTTPEEMPIKNYVDSNNVFHQRVGRVDLSSLEWNRASDGYYYGLSLLLDKPSSVNKYCSSKYLISTTWGVNNTIYASTNSDNGEIYLFDNSIQDANVLKNNLQGVYLYYELEEEKTYPIDGNEIGEQLNKAKFGEKAGGNNLLDLPINIILSEGGGYILNTSGSNYLKNSPFPIKQGKYIFSYNSTSTSAHYALNWDYIDGTSGGYTSGAPVNENNKLSLNFEKDVASITWFINGSCTISNIMLSPIDTDYEPYIKSNKMLTEDTKSLSDYGLDNKFDGQLLSNGYISPDNGQFVDAGNPYWVTSANFMPCKSGEIISITYPSATDEIFIAFYDSNKTYISGYDKRIENSNITKHEALSPINAAYFKYTITRNSVIGTITPQSAGHIGVYINNAIDKVAERVKIKNLMTSDICHDANFNDLKLLSRQMLHILMNYNVLCINLYCDKSGGAITDEGNSSGETEFVMIPIEHQLQNGKRYDRAGQYVIGGDAPQESLIHFAYFESTNNINIEIKDSYSGDNGFYWSYNIVNDTIERASGFDGDPYFVSNDYYNVYGLEGMFPYDGSIKEIEIN